MKTVLCGPGLVEIEDASPPIRSSGEDLLQASYVGLCGTNWNSYRGRSPCSLIRLR
jgi:threonine dehydrogenase-like Zn-dependent dehydrogenase